jgi:hypothetical protein
MDIFFRDTGVSRKIFLVYRHELVPEVKDQNQLVSEVKDQNQLVPEVKDQNKLALPELQWRPALKSYVMNLLFP